MPNRLQHAACVDDWIARSLAGQSTATIVPVFQTALGALWTRTATTLGEVTLGAIAERVVHNAAERHPMFAALKIDPRTGIQCNGLVEHTREVSDAELIEGVRFMLVEFLSVLGNLTAEILTPELHLELSNVPAPQSPAGSDRN